MQKNSTSSSNPVHPLEYRQTDRGIEGYTPFGEVVIYPDINTYEDAYATELYIMQNEDLHGPVEMPEDWK